MTDHPILAALSRCADALAHGKGGTDVYAAVQAGLAEGIGHRLFTLLALSPDRRFVQRFYSSDPDSYPLTGRKDVGDTPWGRHVIGAAKPYLGRTADDIRWAFGDHELIESLGLRSVVNIPVMLQGRVLGTMNLLDREGHYGEADVATAALFAPCLVPAFQMEAARIA